MPYAEKREIIAYFARPIKDKQEFDCIMAYIDQNPVVVGLSQTPEEWKVSGAFYKARIYGLIRSSVFPEENKRNNFSLKDLNNKENIKLDFSWKV